VHGPNDPGRRAADDEAARFDDLLTVILGYTDLVLHDLGSSHPSAADLEVVRRSAERARSMVTTVDLRDDRADQGSKR
jgi:hypothetical protein